MVGPCQVPKEPNAGGVFGWGGACAQEEVPMQEEDEQKKGQGAAPNASSGVASPH